MKAKMIIIAVIIVAITGVIIFFVTKKPVEETLPVVSQADYKNISYEIEGVPIQLKDGVAEMEVAPGSASKSITRVFDNELTEDINGDGMEDVAFILTQDNGASGTFFYVAAALKSLDGYKGTNAIFIGDRIAPQTTEFHLGELVVNYAIREPGEPMTTEPTFGVSSYFKISDGILIEVVEKIVE